LHLQPGDEETSVMHELSIAYSLIEIAVEAAADAGASRVEAVHLQLGTLSGVDKDALLFSYEVAAVGTPLAGSRLLIEEVPAAVYCAVCGCTTTLNSIQSFRCAHCGALTTDIRQGKELEITFMEVADEQSAYS
jgi:hydrogenase nickel incorporation protein HypA/HybF